MYVFCVQEQAKQVNLKFDDNSVQTFVLPNDNTKAFKFTLSPAVSTASVTITVASCWLSGNLGAQDIKVFGQCE
jgi:hypothetical protein